MLKHKKSMKKMNGFRIGIVGGSGFVGFSLAKSLSSIFEVKIIDIKEVKNMAEGVDFESCDIRNYADTAKALSDVDLAIHAAIVQIPLINEKKQLAYEVNFLGTENVCRAVEESCRTKGMILSGTWHTIGERELDGVIDEEFGFRPDKVENRARLYALSKMAQEAIVRFYSEMSIKTYGIIRMGTVLGEGMPEKTAANIFITQGLQGKPITPYKISMYRPMIYVDIVDICKAYEKLALRIANYRLKKTENSLSNIFNVFYPKPLTIFELAMIVKESVIKYSNGRLKPRIEIADDGSPFLFDEKDKDKITVDITKAIKTLELEKITSPKESIEKIIENRFRHNNINAIPRIS